MKSEARILGIDLGDARVGVAVSDELAMLAHPVETIAVRDDGVLERICELSTSYRVAEIVVGVPRNMDGSRGPAAQKALDFIETLRRKTSCRIVPWDERLSTVQAQRQLHEAGRKSRQHRAVIDQAAAQIILQSYLDSRV